MNDTPIIEEFCQESAIAQDVFDCAVSLVPDIEIDQITKEVTGTPLYDLLDWKYKRFGHQAQPNLIGAFFLSNLDCMTEAQVTAAVKAIATLNPDLIRQVMESSE